MGVFIHEKADVQSADIGEGTRIWQNVVVLKGAKIGRNCNLCANTFVESDVVIGDNVTLKCGVSLWDGIRIGNDVFIGPNAAFCNDRYPRAGVHDDRRTLLETIVGDGVSIGSGAVILPGIKIGEHAMIGAGAVVTKDVPPFATVVGNPGRITGYVNAEKVQTSTSNAADSGVSAIGKTGARIYTIPHFADLRGELNVVEFEKIFPFPIKRMFYTYNVGSSQVRGEHAHRKCEQVLIAIHGSLKVVVDDGTVREEYALDNPSKALHIPPGCWGIQYKHSTDCVLLVLASRSYENDDYIRDYSDFLKFKGDGA